MLHTTTCGRFWADLAVGVPCVERRRCLRDKRSVCVRQWRAWACGVLQIKVDTVSVRLGCLVQPRLHLQGSNAQPHLERLESVACSRYR